MRDEGFRSDRGWNSAMEQRIERRTGPSKKPTRPTADPIPHPPSLIPHPFFLQPTPLPTRSSAGIKSGALGIRSGVGPRSPPPKRLTGTSIRSAIAYLEPESRARPGEVRGGASWRVLSADLGLRSLRASGCALNGPVGSDGANAVVPFHAGDKVTHRSVFRKEGPANRQTGKMSAKYCGHFVLTGQMLVYRLPVIHREGG